MEEEDTVLAMLGEEMGVAERARDAKKNGHPGFRAWLLYSCLAADWCDDVIGACPFGSSLQCPLHSDLYRCFDTRPPKKATIVRPVSALS